jgi:hypothetical protein
MGRAPRAKPIVGVAAGNDVDVAEKNFEFPDKGRFFRILRIFVLLFQ